MLLDYENDFGWDTTNDVPINTIVGTAASTYNFGRVIDALAARLWGTGSKKAVFLRVVTALTGASGGIRYDLIAATSLDLSGTPVTLATKTVAAASHTANNIIRLFEVPPTSDKKRYLGLAYTPLTTNSTVGTVVAYIGDEDSFDQNVNIL